MRNLISAIDPIDLGQIEGKGPLGLEDAALEESAPLLNQVISTTIGILTVIATLWFIIQFFIGAVGIIASGGDKTQLDAARNKITYGLIGLVVVVVAVFLVSLIGTILGIENILNPANFVINIWK